MKPHIHIQRLITDKDNLYISSRPSLREKYNMVLHLLFCWVDECCCLKKTLQIRLPLLWAVLYVRAFQLSDMLHLQSMQNKAKCSIEYKTLQRSNSSQTDLRYITIRCRSAPLNYKIEKTHILLNPGSSHYHFFWLKKNPNSKHYTSYRSGTITCLRFLALFQLSFVICLVKFFNIPHEWKAAFQRTAKSQVK